MSSDDDLRDTPSPTRSSDNDDEHNEMQNQTRETLHRKSHHKDRDRQRESSALVVTPPRNNITRRELESNREREKQTNAYLIGKKRKINDGDEDKIKSIVKKYVLPKAKFMDGEGLQPGVIKLKYQRGMGVPPIGETHDYPDFTSRKRGISQVVLENMEYDDRRVEKKVEFWLTWRGTVGNCIRQHRNTVSTSMKTSIIKGM